MNSQISSHNAPNDAECAIAGPVAFSRGGTYHENSRDHIDRLIQAIGKVCNLGKLTLMDERALVTEKASLIAFLRGSATDMVHPEPYKRMTEALQAIQDFSKNPESLAAPHARKSRFKVFEAVGKELVENYPDGATITAICINDKEYENFQLRCDRDAIERAAESHIMVPEPKLEYWTVTLKEVTDEGMALSDRPIGSAESEGVKDKLQTNLDKEVILTVDPTPRQFRIFLPTIVDVDVGTGKGRKK